MRESHDFESILPEYPVRLANFEGPLDLLLHLIRKHEIDVYDIPIALVADQYQAYLDMMQELDLDVAGEFLVMAATLIHIKSRMLVPRIEVDGGQEEPEDPRDALVRRLVEHQKFKAAAELLHERAEVRSAQWIRPDERVAAIAGRRSSGRSRSTCSACSRRSRRCWPGRAPVRGWPCRRPACR